MDTKPNCGNMLVAVGPFAIEAGLVPAKNGETPVRIFNVNTQSLVEAIVQTPGGQVTYEGNASIDGVPGTAAPVGINFKSAIGSVTKKLLPTGKPLDVIDGVEVSCVDIAMPVVLMRAEAFGKTGHETRRRARRGPGIVQAHGSDTQQGGRADGHGRRLETGGAEDRHCSSKPRNGGTIASRYLRARHLPQGAPGDRHGVHRLCLRHPGHGSLADLVRCRPRRRA